MHDNNARELTEIDVTTLDLVCGGGLVDRDGSSVFTPTPDPTWTENLGDTLKLRGLNPSIDPGMTLMPPNGGLDAGIERMFNPSSLGGLLNI
jgi:hypothetical protein